jgi:hypothetical protein
MNAASPDAMAHSVSIAFKRRTTSSLKFSDQIRQRFDALFFILFTLRGLKE